MSNDRIYAGADETLNPRMPRMMKMRGSRFAAMNCYVLHPSLVRNVIYTFEKSNQQVAFCDANIPKKQVRFNAERVGSISQTISKI